MQLLRGLLSSSLAKASVMALVVTLAGAGGGILFVDYATNSQWAQSVPAPTSEDDGVVTETPTTETNNDQSNEDGYTYETQGADPDDPGTSYIAANNTSTLELNGPVRDNVSFNTSSAEVERWMVYYINQERQSRGLEPVTPNETIASYARAHSYNLARHDEGGHVDYNDRTPCRLTNIEGTEVQANMALQNDDWESDWGATWDHEATSEKELAQRLVIAWLDSPPHRAAILAENPNLNVGAGVYFDKAPNGDGPPHKVEEDAYRDNLEPEDTVVQATVNICSPNGNFSLNRDAPRGEENEDEKWDD